MSNCGWVYACADSTFVQLHERKEINEWLPWTEYILFFFRQRRCQNTSKHNIFESSKYNKEAVSVFVYKYGKHLLNVNISQWIISITITVSALEGNYKNVHWEKRETMIFFLFAWYMYSRKITIKLRLKYSTFDIEWNHVPETIWMEGSFKCWMVVNVFI